MMSTNQQIQCKKRIILDDICEGGNILHLMMGYIRIIEFHNPGTL